MKRIKIIFATVLAACVLCSGSIYAEEAEWENYWWEEDDFRVMEVVNCNEWVSLREYPDVNSTRLAKIPLGAYVYDCEWYSDEFMYGEYGGQYGYILSDYLIWCETDYGYEEQEELWEGHSFFMHMVMSYEELMESGKEILDFEIGDETIVAVKEYGEGETLSVICFDEELEPLWGYQTGVDFLADLDATDAFIAGTEEDPRLMIFHTEEGLYMIDPETGDIEWVLSTEELSLTGSICHAVDEEGTMYLAGYYGPDPVAVSMDGTILWESYAENEDIYWPYEINIMDDNIIVNYDSGNGEGHYVVAYDSEGSPVWTDISLY